MTTDQATASPAGLTELAGMLQEVTGEGDDWARRVTPASRIEDDLDLESLELTALGELLRRRYGPAVDLAAYLSDLDFDELAALTVGDLLAVVRRGPEGGTG